MNIVYRTTNLINGKEYIGTHVTDKLEDGYMGSGSILKRAIKKYGVENFTREVLFLFETKEEMHEKEKELVNEEYISRTDTYNVKLGGYGGFDHLNDGSPEHIERTKRAVVLSHNSLGKEGLIKNGKRLSKWCMENLTPEQRSDRVKGNKNWLGKTHKESSKKKIGEKNSIHQQGNGNSQYGTCWIYSEKLEQNKKIPKEELGYYLQADWQKGRKMKYKRV